MRTLDEIAIHFGTDKSSKGHSYAQYYDLIFSAMKDKSIDLMEIGIWEGASLKMWQEWMPNARIYGVDIVEMSQYNDKRIQTYVADQNNPQQLHDLMDKLPRMDIICDDGSHIGEHQWNSLCHLFHYVKPGGLYVVEDILCSYDSRWSVPVNFMDRVRDLAGRVQMNGAIPNSHICANKREAVLKYETDYLSANIDWIFIACGIIFIKKL